MASAFRSWAGGKDFAYGFDRKRFGFKEEVEIWFFRLLEMGRRKVFLIYKV